MKKKDGFTYIEILIALAILGIGLVAILALFPSGFQGSIVSENITTAIRLADDLMEEIRGKRWDENSPLTGGPATILSATLGPEGTETRATFDDIDDYNGLDENPPTDAGNNPLNEYSRFTRRVRVEYVSANDLNTPLLGPTANKRITITVLESSMPDVVLVTVVSNY